MTAITMGIPRHLLIAGTVAAFAAVLAMLAGVIILTARQTFPVRATAEEPVPAR